MKQGGPRKTMGPATSYKGVEATSVDYSRGPARNVAGGLTKMSKVHSGAGRGSNTPSGARATQLRSGGKG